MSTAHFISYRFAQAVFALFCIVTITFFLNRFAPGNPFLDEKAIPEHLVDNMKAYYGLDKPLFTQYLVNLKNLLVGDLGASFGNKGYTVNEVIAQSWPVSARIGLCGLGLALLLGVPIGVFAAAHRNSRIDYGLMSLALLGICLPTFVIAPILGNIFGLRLKWFDVAGWEGSSAWVLASATLGIYYAAYIARLTRGSMLDQLNQDYIRTAQAKGVSPNKILFKHAFRGGISPVVAYLGPALASLIGGTFVVEFVFNLPGLGQHFVRAVTNRDYTLIQGTVIVFATLILVFNLLSDLAQVWLDPRRKLKT